MEGINRQVDARREPLRRTIASVAALVLAGVAGLSTGCGADGGDGAAAERRAGVFVGTVEGTNAYIGIKSDGEEVGGYLCNGRRGLSEDKIVSVWLDESELGDDETAALTDRDGDTVGEVTLSEAGASGEVRIGGESHAFSAEPATGEAGIYRQVRGELGEPGWLEKGWILLADGSSRGARHTGGVNITDGTSNTVTSLSTKPTAKSFLPSNF